MSINMSDYNRAGIFIEERNNSVVDRPAAQEAVVNFIPGFSRKGTVFNRPVLVKTKSDRNAYFGDIDRFLEKKGSYFHRTIEIALQTAPVWALNILKTTSLDTLNYASVSVSAQYDNNPVATRQYDEFFNKAGFWQRDTESFLFFARNSQRMLHFTNVSDKKITIFMFKSSIPGYDITAEIYYGGKEKVPTWMSPSDFISDYMVRVVAVNGDWSNYVTLAADPTWSKYFASSGLRKNKVDDFIRDRGVTTLGDYTGSLIPFFRDNKNNNIFIETLVNLDTDRTGLFAAFDIDNVETDFPNGNVDIIGQTLVDLDKQKINFMSYVDTIEETDFYDNMPLDTLSNVIGIGNISSRTTTKTNGTLSGMGLTLGGSFSTTATPTLAITGGTAILNNVSLAVASGTVNLTPLSAPALNTNYRIDTVYIDTTGVIQLVSGSVLNGTYASEVLAVAGGLTYPASMPNNAIVLGYIYRSTDNLSTYSNTYVPVALGIGVGSFVPLTIGGSGTNDIVVGNTATTTLDLTFNTTAIATKANYKAWRRVLFFNELVSKKVLTNSIIIDSLGAKIDLSTAVWSDNYSAGSGDKQITISVAGVDIKTASYVSGVSTAGVLAFYYNDNEFVMGLGGLETRNTVSGTANYGIVAKNSEMYQDFYNGMINTGDYFFIKKSVTTSMKFVHYANTSNPTSVGDWIILSAADATALGIGTGSNNFNLLIQSHPVNAGTYLMTNGYDYDAVPAPGTPEFGLQGDGYLAVGEIAFQVNNLVSTYLITQTIDAYDYDAKVYLKMYFAGSTMKAQFMADNTLITPFTIPGGLLSINTTINVYSGEAAYEQTLEIEQHAAYTITDTKVLIDLVRYPEVKVGDYVKAYIDSGLLQPGQFPKKFSRIIKKTPWSGNVTYGVQYAEITVDIKLDIQMYGSDMQTTRYTKIEDYIDTYKAISLGGFAVQATSVPDGTESRQSDILDIIGKDTALYYAITNKNKFNFRYLIDSFGLGLTEFSKQQLADLTGKRKNCIGFLNMPSVKSLKASSNPSYINTDGTLNLEYVKLGGNPSANPAFLYSFAQGAGKDDGRDTIGYFFPYVTVNDNGRPMIFPPASYCANTYMRKLNSPIAGIYNWTVAAGTEDGKILGISNVEMDFTEKDLEHMYAMGANPIMYAKNKGFYIETEWTALISPLSALSYLHVREILIDLENELYAMLLKYQWKFNTPAIRAKIKREADEICQRFVDRSALYAYNNIIDESNNTSSLIDNQFGLLETYIEPVKAMGIIVNVINVMATGALGASTGFGS
jgi:hypothetical protein